MEGSGEKKEVVRAWQTFLGNEWDNKGELRGEGGNGLVVEAKPLGMKYYFQERAGCEYPYTEDGNSEGKMLTFPSLATFILEESNDSYGALLHGHDLRNAVSNGEQYVTPSSSALLYIQRLTRDSGPRDESRI